ncbi:methylated-DNA--[protein]-cysteine S-methyltransferase [Undibacterium sp. Di26W]|uniref:methylated-DNA--[protein]-cysteine S-methyltransferase n=1 Tax=Undibacterium sp. Di26W TaxID=3413035 RepID=UPI003BF2BDE3
MKTIHYMNMDSPLGPLLLAASDSGICGVYFEHHKHFKGSAGWQLNPQHPLLLQAVRQLQDYFAGQRQDFDLPLDVSAGTAFQQAVWAGLRQIPFGMTTSYGQLAQHIRQPAAVRAVGAANGRNPISIIIPCHRVIASSGALTGYAGGLENKQALLALENGQAKHGQPKAQHEQHSRNQSSLCFV